jgi:hypothetical protein
MCPPTKCCCCGLYDGVKTWASIVVGLNVFAIIVSIGLVVGAGAAVSDESELCRHERKNGGNGYGVSCSDIETMQTGWTIGVVVSVIQLGFNIFGCQAVAKYSASNTGHYWKVTLLFNCLNLIAPLMSAGHDYGFAGILMGLVTFSLWTWYAVAVRAVAQQLADGRIKTPHAPVSGRVVTVQQAPLPPPQLQPTTLNTAHGVVQQPLQLTAPPTAPPPTAPPAAASTTTVKELREQAVAAGVDSDAIEEARDQDDPKAALLALIASAKPDPVMLRTMNTKDLRIKAGAIGVGADAIELARDSDDPKEALISLIMAAVAPPVALPSVSELQVRAILCIDVARCARVRCRT